MRNLFVRVRLGKALTHYIERARFTICALGLVDLLAPRRRVAPPFGKVSHGGDPGVVERPVVVEDGDVDFRVFVHVGRRKECIAAVVEDERYALVCVPPTCG